MASSISSYFTATTEGKITFYDFKADRLSCDSFYIVNNEDMKDNFILAHLVDYKLDVRYNFSSSHTEIKTKDFNITLSAFPKKYLNTCTEIARKHMLNLETDHKILPSQSPIGGREIVLRFPAQENILWTERTP